MKKRDIHFSVCYSARLERMHATLHSRVDRLLSAAQFAAALSVFTKVANTEAVLILIALMSLYSFVQQPGRVAAAADHQAKRYLQLSVLLKSMPLEKAQVTFAEVQKDDSQVLGALCQAAEYGEWVRAGERPDFSLSLRERAIAWFAGDLPRSPASLPTDTAV